MRMPCEGAAAIRFDMAILIFRDQRFLNRTIVRIIEWSGIVQIGGVQMRKIDGEIRPKFVDRGVRQTYSAAIDYVISLGICERR